MKKKNFFAFIVIFLLLFSCSKNIEEKKTLSTNNLESQMIESYNEGISFLEKGDGISAAKKFNQSEILYPQSIWAAKSILMSAYSYYVSSNYVRAIRELERYLKKYPTETDKSYALYMLAMSNFQMIVDEKKDLRPLLEAKKYFTIVETEYSNSEFAEDAKFKLKLIEDYLASKEIFLARYYIKKQKWVAAINRLKNIVINFDETIYIEEALHRLVEINYKLGLISEAEKYANLLGYNYNSSEWYNKSYKILNSSYEISFKEIEKNKNKSKFFKFFKIDEKK